MKQFLRFLLILLPAFGGAGGSLFAQKQGQAAIDSLLPELPKMKEDTNKVNLLTGLSYTYYTINPNEGIKYGEQGLALATRLQWKKGMAAANNRLGLNYMTKTEYAKSMEYQSMAKKIYEEIIDKKGMAMVAMNIGILCYTQSDYPKALEYYLKALKMEEEIGNKDMIARTTLNIGIVYWNQNDYPKALEYELKALKSAEEMGDKDLIARIDISIGGVCSNQGNYPKALEYYLKALKMDEEIGNKDLIVRATQNIGLVYSDQSDYPKALEYYLKALKVAEKIENKDLIARTTQNIGLVYSNQSDYPKALEYYLKALKMDEEIKNKDLIAATTMSIGRVCSNQGDYSKALEYYLKALKMDEEIGNKRGIAYCYASLGWNYTKIVMNGGTNERKQAILDNGTELHHGTYRPDKRIPVGRNALLDKAVDYIDRAIVIDKKIGNVYHLSYDYSVLFTADSLLGNYKGALDAHIQYMILKDSVFSQENAKKIVQQQMKFEYGKREDSMKLENAKNEKVAALRFQRQRNYTYMGVAGILLLASFSFFIVKERGKSEKERKKSDDLLLNILPREVATELKTTGATTAKHYDNVTVLFTDFVNFTNAGERMKPQDLIDELHTCFKTFDEITGKYKIEKIKTIGDAYLAVGGLPSADPKHAEHIVKAALEINAFMQDRLAKLGERTFEIRIGIHSGSVVAGIVGVKKFAYDIWGDTVNTAARMEQNSEAGKINISQTTYDLVKDKFTCEYRGEIDAKNKGQLKMYFVS